MEVKPPSHLTKVGRDAFLRYLEVIPEFPQLAEALAEVDQMHRSVAGRMRSVKNPPTAQEQRLYLSLIDKRVSLLTAAGLTPKAQRYLAGQAVVKTKTDPQADEDDDFLDS